MANRKQRRCYKKIGVSMYLVNREFGGPEEGGWWFDHGKPIRGTTVTFFNTESAARYREVLRRIAERHNEAGKPYTDLGSVLCTGALKAVMEVPGFAPAPFPQRRPRYE